MYIKEFKLKKEYRTIKPFTLKFKDGLNLIVGDNGSGKSTLLNLIFDASNGNENEDEKEIKEITLSEYCQKHGTNVKFFDAEKHNPRIKGSAEFSNDALWDIQSHFMSHGEVIFPMVNSVKSVKNAIVLFDEPEAGVSLSNQKEIYNSLLAAEKNKCQLIVSTHSYVIIKNTPEVFDMETREWIKSETYLKKFNNE